MIEQHRKNRKQVEIFSIEKLVSAENLLSKIDSAADFMRIHETVKDLYYSDNGI